MSDALVWQTIKNSNAFLVKRERSSRRGMVQFSSESGNLMNVNTFKYSGLANSKTVGIDTTDKAITMTLKVII
jgi:large subunit ribosomal protein L28e